MCIDSLKWIFMDQWSIPGDFHRLSIFEKLLQPYCWIHLVFLTLKTTRKGEEDRDRRKIVDERKEELIHEKTSMHIVSRGTFYKDIHRRSNMKSGETSLKLARDRKSERRRDSILSGRWACNANKMACLPIARAGSSCAGRTGSDLKFS